MEKFAMTKKQNKKSMSVVNPLSDQHCQAAFNTLC